MSNSWQNIQSKVLKSDSKLNLLIAINVAVYLLIGIPSVFEWLFTGSSQVITFYSNEYLAIPAYLPKLIIRFWTPLTYMFMHAGIFHILFNMLWLYWLGQIFEEYLGKQRIVGVYLLGGLAGALFYILSYNFFPVFAAVLPVSTAVGASASVMAIIVATATLLPDYSIPLMFIFTNAWWIFRITISSRNFGRYLKRNFIYFVERAWLYRARWTFRRTSVAISLS